MLIALDYDGTYTADPNLWRLFILNAQNAGHEVVCITMRYEHELGNMCELMTGMIKVVHTGRRAKKQAAAELGLFPDIWIDDKPGWILEGIEI